jgi:hypothetical protein
MGFKSLVYLQIDGDSISVMYTDDIQSYMEPNITVLYTAPFMQTNTLQLDGVRSGNNLIINAYMGDSLFYSGQIDNPDEGVFSGQMFIDVSKNEGETLSWAIDEIEINYNALYTADSFTDDFSNSNSPWFRLGDWDNVGESVSINNDRLNFNYTNSSKTSLYLITPVGSVKDFSIELQGGSEGDHSAAFGISRFYDFKNYVSMLLDGDSVYVGYALNNDGDIDIIASAEFNGGSDTKLKFAVEENSSNLSLNVWADDVLVLSGDINNAPEILKSGHIVIGFDGESVNSYFDYANLTFTRLKTDLINEEVEPISTYQLYQNYPNPFNPSTTILYQIPNTDNVSLKIYDILGNVIAALVNETQTSGKHKVEFNSKGLSSGIYFYRLHTSSYSETKKLLLLK